MVYGAGRVAKKELGTKSIKRTWRLGATSRFGGSRSGVVSVLLFFVLGMVYWSSMVI